MRFKAACTAGKTYLLWTTDYGFKHYSIKSPFELIFSGSKEVNGILESTPTKSPVVTFLPSKWLYAILAIAPRVLSVQTIRSSSNASSPAKICLQTATAYGKIPN
jgi:hypothetical protein